VPSILTSQRECEMDRREGAREEGKKLGMVLHLRCDIGSIDLSA